MTEQMDFFTPLYRPSDPETSRFKPVGRASQCHELLKAYGNAGELTDEQAARIAGIRHGWKRCSDLRHRGLIEPTGETVVGESGAPQMVCSITFRGKVELGRLA